MDTPNTQDTQNTHHIKMRWSSLLLLSIIVLILISNTAQLQDRKNSAQDTVATESAKSVTVSESDETQTDSSYQNTLSSNIKLAMLDTNPPLADKTNTTIAKQWTIRSGDTLSGILDRFNVYQSLGDILSLGKQIKPLLNLQVEKQISVLINNNQLEKITYAYHPQYHLILSRQKKGFTIEKHTLPIEKREAFASATIDDSFYLSAKKAGLSDEIIIETANILAWDIDFILDIRKGDSFSILYEEDYLNGENLGNAQILAVKFINRNQTYHALLYEHKSKSGYYSIDGRNVRKKFLRSPLKFSYISSHFNPRRLHPILNVIRPHRGIDYAAKTGTPVYAAGDGKVVHRGWKAGYGNTVIIRHGGRYDTLYAHLSVFARKAKLGTKVKQGQTIAYVGKTGYATGPHLHYEFRISGVHKNPLTIKLPNAKPLVKSRMQNFKESTQPLLTKLNTVSRHYAKANHID